MVPASMDSLVGSIHKARCVRVLDSTYPATNSVRSMVATTVDTPNTIVNYCSPAE